jgi:hypothetical protein
VSLLWEVVFRTVCQTTHQRLAVDALRHLRIESADRWADLLLVHAAEFLAGCEAPDRRFQDFLGHVWFVDGPSFGEAPAHACLWYDRTVDAVRRRQWAEAAFAAGALSHYVTDPFFPLNTARTEESSALQQPLQWAVAWSYGRLQHLLEHDLGGYPRVETSRRADWLPHLVQTGAVLASAHFTPLIDHFDLGRAVRDPLAGLDQEAQDRLAICLGHAVVGYARVLERALEEADVQPPAVDATWPGFAHLLIWPLRQTVGWMRWWSEQLQVAALEDELKRTGRVVANLTPEVREVRRLHAEQVLHVSLYELDRRPLAPTGSLHASGSTPRWHPNRLLTRRLPQVCQELSPPWLEASQRARHLAQLAGDQRGLPGRSASDPCDHRADQDTHHGATQGAARSWSGVGARSAGAAAVSDGMGG